MPSHKGRGRDPETLAQRPHLPDVELALAGQDLRDHALATDLGEVSLLETVLLHQVLQGLHASGLGQWMVLSFVVLSGIVCVCTIPWCAWGTLPLKTLPRPPTHRSAKVSKSGRWRFFSRLHRQID